MKQLSPDIIIFRDFTVRFRPMGAVCEWWLYQISGCDMERHLNDPERYDYVAKKSGAHGEPEHTTNLDEAGTCLEGRTDFDGSFRFRTGDGAVYLTGSDDIRDFHLALELVFAESMKRIKSER